MAREPQSFGEQAAKFSLFAPIAAFLTGAVTLGNHARASVVTIVTAFDFVLLVAGLSAGIAALRSMRRFGRRGILGWAVAGVVLSGIGVLGDGLGFLGVGNYPRARRQLVGQWQHAATGPNAGNIDLSLNDDNSFTYSTTGGPAGSNMTLAGAWALTRGMVIGITVDRVDVGDPTNVGKRVALGTVRTIDQDELVLSTDTGDEVFHHP